MVAARAYIAGWTDYRKRDTLQHAVDFAKGVLIGVVVVMSLWLVFG